MAKSMSEFLPTKALTMPSGNSWTGRERGFGAGAITSSSVPMSGGFGLIVWVDLSEELA